MAAKIIISYDDTANDHDALALGRLFADAGAEVCLAYVRHSEESDLASEQQQERASRALLDRGVALFGDPDVERHVVVSASTGEGLQALALRIGADAVVFGSDYRTAKGHVRPNTSAQRLLEGGPVAVAIAPAGLREHGELSLGQIGVLSDEGDASPRETAQELAERLGANVAPSTAPEIDMLVVGSRLEAPEGRLLLSSLSSSAIETATYPVLAVPRGIAVRFARKLVSA